MPGDQAAADDFFMISRSFLISAAMKKQHPRFDISLPIRASPEDKLPAREAGPNLIAECRVVFRQDKKGRFHVQADLTWADTPLAERVIRQLEWLDWPL